MRGMLKDVYAELGEKTGSRILAASKESLTAFRKDAIVFGTQNGKRVRYQNDKFRPSLVIVEAGLPVSGGVVSGTDSAGPYYYHGCSCNTRSQRMM